MTDDAELRARASARMAAHRADGSADEPEAEGPGSAGDSPAAQGPRALAPARPWVRSAHGDPSVDGPPAEPMTSAPDGPGPSGLGPVRPWLRREAPEPSRSLPEPAPPADGRLRPARPWAERAAEPAPPAPATLTPSNPGMVLQGLVDEQEQARHAPAEPSRRGWLGRRPAAEALPEPAPEPRLLAEAQPDVTAAPPAEPVPPTEEALEPPAPVEPEPVEEYPWQRREEVDLDLHGAPTWDPAMYPPVEDQKPAHRSRRALSWMLARKPEPETTEETVPVGPSTDVSSVAPEPVVIEPTDETVAAEPTAAEPVAEPVADPVADPVAEQPEPGPETAVASRPEPVTEPVVAPPVVTPPAVTPRVVTEPVAPEPVLAEPVAADLPGADSLAPEPEPETAVAAALPADPEPEAAGPKRARLSRIFGRRHEEEQDEEPYQSFDLPEPDAVFERPWLQTPPRPTRDWDRPLGTALGTTAETSDGSSTQAPAEPVVAPAPVPTAAEPAPEPITPPEPVAEPEPEPEPVAEQPEPAPGPAPEPVAEPEPTALVHPTPTPSRRPRPGPTPPHRPRPTAGPTPGPVAPTTIGIAGISGVAGQHRPAHAAPSGTISGSIGTSTTTPPLDLSRFLQTTEPRPEDDEDEDGRSDHHDGPPPGTGMSADSDGGGGPRRPGRSGRSGRGSRLRRTLVRSVAIVAVAVLAAVLLRAFVVQPYYIPSASMEPTLHGCPTCNDDRVLVDKFSYRIHSPRVRDIVVFHRPPGVSAESVLIKRIVALGGDVVQLRDGDLYVNGLQVDEPYINKACGAHATRPLTNVSRWVVPANDVFVMGDNRCDSLDSRSFGPIPVSSIIGRAFAIVWPLKRARLL